jgi:hypothetical protein|tara:strand:+ start:605 stop:781 length:177 start_codon:yes stop_codon:yes gene_type:complete
MEETKNNSTRPSHFRPVEDRMEWIVEHKTPNRAQRRKFLKDSRKAAKKAIREEKRLGQ